MKTQQSVYVVGLCLYVLVSGCQSGAPGAPSASAPPAVPPLPAGASTQGLAQQQFTKSGTGESFFTLVLDCRKGKAYEDVSKRQPAPQMASFEPEVESKPTTDACPQMPDKPTYRYQFLVHLKYSLRSDANRSVVGEPETQYIDKYDCNCIDGQMPGK